MYSLPVHLCVCRKKQEGERRRRKEKGERKKERQYIAKYIYKYTHLFVYTLLFTYALHLKPNTKLGDKRKTGREKH